MLTPSKWLIKRYSRKSNGSRSVYQWFLKHQSVENNYIILLRLSQTPLQELSKTRKSPTKSNHWGLKLSQPDMPLWSILLWHKYAAVWISMIFKAGSVLQIWSRRVQYLISFTLRTVLKSLKTWLKTQPPSSTTETLLFHVHLITDGNSYLSFSTNWTKMK